MKIKIRTVLFLVVGLTGPMQGWAQDDAVEIVATQVRGDIYMLTGKGGNIGLFNGKDGSFMVDDQFAPLTDRIIAAVKSTGGDMPQYLINTHFHGDHTGGNENLGNAGTLIMSHHGVRERLQNGSFIGAFGMKSPPASAAALPTLTYSEKLHLHINDETVRIVHVPNAHTDGDSFVVFTNSNVLHAGDLFFNGFFPFIDAANGGSLRGVIAGVDAMLQITDADSRIIPGHGPLAGRAELQAYREMLASAYARLLKLKNEGKSADQAVAEKPLKDLEAKWGGGIFTADKWIGVVYPAVF
ncbi:MAG: MBL fold metallo-hydrolase [Gammaproteobacteria bacterium]|nr:MBL fold metallo-hydrolase [Gammaproteobacteria bacterium]